MEGALGGDLNAALSFILGLLWEYRQIAVNIVALIIAFVVFRRALASQINGLKMKFGELSDDLKRRVGDINSQLASHANAADAQLKKSADEFESRLRLVAAEMQGSLSQQSMTFRESVQTASREFAQVRERTADEIEKSKRQIEQQVADLVSVATPRQKDSSIDDDIEEANRFGQIQQMWGDVKLWVDDRRWYARAHEESAYKRERLSELSNYNYDDVLSLLFRYGWLSEKEFQYSLELSGLFRSLRNRRTAISQDILNNYRKTYNRWLKV